MPPTGSSLWSTTGPASWPPPPERMSISRLLESEICPLRVALRAADYSSLWSGSGYPPRFSLPAFLGAAVHAAMADLSTELRRQGCRNVQEPSAMEVIKSMGGYTRVAEKAAERLLAENAINPRFASAKESATQLVRAQVPELRRRIQSLMCQIKLGLAKPAGGGGWRERGPLRIGVYSEVWLEVPELEWVGRADQLIISADGAEITEFKTGEPEPHHAFQLSVYALLWSRDRVLNPSGQRPVALRLCYLNRSQNLPVPSEAELEVLAKDLVTRSKLVCAALGARPPPARYQPETCNRCDVRQLCDVYWVGLKSSAEIPIQDGWSDIEAVILGRHGELSYDARIECSDGTASGAKALIRFQYRREFQKGDCIRILGGFMTFDDDADVPSMIVRVGALTEIYRKD